MGTAALGRIVRIATTRIPIVFANVQDPVSAGLVTSIAQPGANITGAGIHYDELCIKRLELSRELLPSARRLLVVLDRGGGGIPPSARESLAKARERLNFQIAELDVADVNGGLCRAAERAKQSAADAILPFGNILESAERYGDCLVELQAATGIPVFDDSLDTVQKGVAVALGEDQSDSYRRAADIAARILSGAKPADVPVDMQMRIGMHINAASAKRLGIKLPQSVLMRADRVVD